MSPAVQLNRFQSLRTANFTESVIREMTRLAVRVLQGVTRRSDPAREITPLE